MGIKLKVLVSFSAAFLGVLPAAYAQEERPSPEGTKIIEIRGEEAKPVEVPLPPLSEKIEEEKLDLPELPKTIRNFGELDPASKTRLDQLEMDYASGKITETEYEMKRDTLFREANITF